MDPHSFIARAEAQRWIGIAEKLLISRDLVGSKTFAIRAKESDPRLEAADQILVITDTLLAAEKRVSTNNGSHQPDYYAILQLPQFDQNTEHITDQYRRLAVILNPNQNRFPCSEQAFRLVNDAWAVLSNPMRKSMYDNELPHQMNNNNLGFNIEQQHHNQQHNFFSTNQELAEPQQTFQSRVSQTHQHNFLNQNPVQKQEQMFQPQVQPFQVTSVPRQQTRQSPQPQAGIQSPPHPPFSWPQTSQVSQPQPQQHDDLKHQLLPQTHYQQQGHLQPQVTLQQQLQLKQQEQQKHQQELEQRRMKEQQKLQQEQELKRKQEMQSVQQEQEQRPQKELEQKRKLERQKSQEQEQRHQQELEQQRLQEQQKREQELEQQRLQELRRQQELDQHLQEQQRQQELEQQRLQELQRVQQVEDQQRQQEQEQQRLREQHQHEQEEEKRRQQEQQQQQQQQALRQNVTPVQLPSHVNSNNSVMEEESELEEEPEEETQTAYEHVDDSPTFWTACPYCFYMYEYPKLYVECTLCCDNCKRAFQAVPIPSPPPTIKGRDAYFYCWGYFPVGVLMSDLQKNNKKDTTSKWTPFSPLYDASSNTQNHLNECAAPKKNLFVNKSSGPRIYFDDNSDYVFIGVSDTSDDSDIQWDKTKKKKLKRTSNDLISAFKERVQVLALRARDTIDGNVKNKRNSIRVQEGVVVHTLPVVGSDPRKQPGQVAKESGKLDLNVEFDNNEGEEVGSRVAARTRVDGHGEEDNIEEVIGFFEGLDEFLDSLPILSVGNEEKVKAA